MKPITIDITQVERHPLSSAWPEMSDDDFERFRQSILLVGLIDPIVIFEGMILDGFHRFMVCEANSIPMHFVEYEGDDPAGFVIGKHARRNLTQGQIALSITAMSEWKPGGRPNNYAPGAQLFSATQMAEKAGVSLRTVVQAKSVITKGSDELISAVKSGEVSLKAAEAVSKLDKSEQMAALKKPLKPTEEPQEPPKLSEEDYEQIMAKESQEIMQEASLRAVEMNMLVQSNDVVAALRSLILERDAEIVKLQHEVAGLRQRMGGMQEEINFYKAQTKRFSAALKKQESV
jgi:NACalpha-BTF3-like transcription factor